MLAALHFFDPVIGFDAHIVLLPTPAGPVPKTVPLVFLGMIFDWGVFLPPKFVGVLVNGVPRAHVGTPGFGTHVPMMGKFVKKPADKAEVMLGSSTVSIGGDPMAYGPLPVLTCHDIGSAAPPGSTHARQRRSLMLPTSFAIPIPYPAQVFIGGAPTSSLTALVGQIRRPAVLRLCKTLRKTKAGRCAARLVHRADKHRTLLQKAYELYTLK